MLMDEPFAAVDPIVRSRLQDQFLDIQAHLGKTIVFVTHDIDEAIKMADRIAILNSGAFIEQYAPPEEILRVPASEFVKEFVGSERGLKRLGLIRVGDVGLEDGVVAPSDSIPTVAPDSSLREVLDAIVSAGSRAAVVIGEGNRPLGVLSLERISREIVA